MTFSSYKVHLHPLKSICLFRPQKHPLFVAQIDTFSRLFASHSSIKWEKYFFRLASILSFPWLLLHIYTIIDREDALAIQRIALLWYILVRCRFCLFNLGDRLLILENCMIVVNISKESKGSPYRESFLIGTYSFSFGAIFFFSEDSFRHVVFIILLTSRFLAFSSASFKYNTDYGKWEIDKFCWKKIRFEVIGKEN